MVYKGKYIKRKEMDPHFYESNLSPIARFKPIKEGWEMACNLAKNIK